MRYLLLSVFLLGAVVVWAADPKVPGKPSTETKTEDAVSTEQGEQTGGQDEKSPTWPRPYRPSEEISADSIVPFPTDI